MNSGVPRQHESPARDSLAANLSHPTRGGLSLPTKGTNRTSRVGAILLGSISTLIFASSALAADAPVGLGTAESFSVLAGSTITNTGPTTMFGDLGLAPGSSVTGEPHVLGQTHIDDAVATEAKNSLTTAYNEAAKRPTNGSAGTELAGQEFAPGVYTASKSLLLSSGSVTLNAGGDPNAVFIFQIGSTLITGSNTSVSLVGGAQACNVFWQVGSSATLGSGTRFVGTVMAAESITAGTAATIHGRLLAQTAAVTLEDNTITTSTCAREGGGGGGGGGGGTEVTTPEETAALEKAATGGGTTTGGTTGTGGETTTSGAPTTVAGTTSTSAASTAAGTTSAAGVATGTGTGTGAARPIASKSIAKHHKRHRARKTSKPHSPARPALPHRRGSFTG